MAREYIVRTGASFRRNDGSLATGGDRIELEDDVAELWRHSVDPVTEGEAAPPAPAAGHAD